MKGKAGTNKEADKNRNRIILLLFDSMNGNYKAVNNYTNSRKHGNKEYIIYYNIIANREAVYNKET